MAVEIPVVVDIDKAFQEAAKRVPQAIAPMQKAVDEKTLEVVVEINKKGDVAEVLDFVGKSKKSMSELQYAIKSVKQQLDELYQKTGGNVDLTQGEGKALSEALIILKDIVAQRQSLSRAIEKNALDVQREIEAERQHQAAINMVTKSIDDLNAKLAAWRQDLNSADTSSSAFVKAAQNAGLLERALERVNSKARIIGMNTGSIDQLNAKLQEVNRKFNAMPADAREQLGDRLLADYKAISKELEKEGRTLQQIIAEESRLEQMRQKGIQSRRYENAILNTTVKTTRVLQEQERILSDRLSRATIGSGKYKQLKADLEGVRAEIEKVNGKVSEATIPALEKADTRLANLVKRSIQLVALHSATTFVRNIREVTSEFEMQRVALGGIIQDTEKANSLFKQIKAAAVESPFEIKDLVTYTKQLSAYRVETEDLFRVTMQLADVSAGLGVDMNRLILAYGQVKSASVLRGQELRQFTEAGIPLVKLLSDKFVELGRAGTTTADVFELISKRAVPFEMIAEIFDDMTQKGGMFYKMQEKQSETLLGQWNNLKDSLSIMYDEMGNTEVVHGAMTALMNDAKFLFQNWRLISEAVKAAVVQYGALKIASLWMPNLRRELGLAKKAQDALTRSTELSKYAMESGSKSALREAARLKTYSSLVKLASMETKLFHRAWLMLKAAMSGGGWIGLAVGVVTALSSALFSAYKESNRLNNELKRIGAEGETSINRSVSNFNRLAHAAVNAADGSKEQTAAVAELKRTYGDIIPVQQLEANALRELQGNYESLTRAIREKISEQIREQKVSTIVDEYGKKITKKQSKASTFLEAYGLDKEQIRAVMDALQGAVEDGLISTESTVYDRSELFRKTIQDLTGVVVDFGNGFRDLSGTWRDVRDLDKAENALNDLLDVYLGLNTQIRNVDDSMSGAIGTYGKFAKMSKDMGESLANIEIDAATFGKKGTFKYNQENIRQRVEVYWDYIQKAFEEVNRERAEKIDISSALLGDGKIDFDFINRAVEEAMKGGKNTRLDSFVNSIQEGYERLVPSDRIVNLVRAKVDEFANAYNVQMDTAQQYFKKADDTMEDYVKSLQDSEKALTSSVNQMELNNKEIENGTLALKAYSQAEIDAAKNTLLFVQALIEYLAQFKKKKDKEPKTPYVQDPFIKQLQDRMKFMKDFQKGYEDLQKYMSSSAALGKESAIMLTRGMSLGIDPAEQQKAAEGLSKWYKDTYNSAFDYLKKTKGVTGTLQEFLSRQITGNTNRDKMLKDFQSLIQSLFDAKTDFDTAQTTKNIENALNRVKDEIKRSETARNFYQDILDLTGDEDLATSMSVSVYGGIGDDFKDRIKKELVDSLNSLDEDSFKGLDDAIRGAFEKGDYEYLVKNLEKVPKELRDTVKQVASDSEKFSSEQIRNWIKELAEFKTYGEKRVQLAKQTAQEIAKINASDLPDEQKKRLSSEYLRKEAEEAAKLEYEAFKDTPMYISLFENLDAASTKMLRNMKANLVGLKENWKDLDPTDLKEMQRRIEEIDNQLASKNPFKTIVEGIKAYRDITKGTSRSQIESKAISDQANATEQRTILSTLAKEYEAKKNNATATKEEVAAAKAAMEAQAKITDDAQKTANESHNTATNLKNAAGLIEKGMDGLQKWTDAFSEVGNSVKGLMDEILPEEDAAYFGEQFDNVMGALNGISKAGQNISKLILNPLDINYWASAISGVVDAVASIFGASNAAKVKKANEKIKEQDRLINNLEYEYGRLGNATAKSFGSDYIANYNKQLEILEAKAAAYKAQADAERSKGKKADEDTAKGYEQSAQEANDAITDMRNQLSEFFTGTDLTSAAKDFAEAWIEAYKEFGSTTAAMKEKFNDMIESMVVNSLAAQLIQGILKPVFDQIDEAAKDGDLTAREIGAISAMLPERMQMINDAMTGMFNELGAAGINLRQQAGQFTGIARNIAGASEESITGLAAGINTQNFYMQHIDMNVALILSYLTGGASTAGASVTGEVVDPYKDQMLLYAAHIPAIDQNLADLLVEVRKVIKPKGTTSTHYVATNL